MQLIDIGLNVDTSSLDSTIEDLSERLGTLEGLNTCGKDINNLVDESDVERIVDDRVDNLDKPDEDRVQDMIDRAIDALDIPDEGMTESEVQELIDTAINDADNADVTALENKVKDLERRFDLYAQRVDALREQGGEYMLGDVPLPDAFNHLSTSVERLSQDFDVHIAALEARLDALGTESAKGLTLLDLLRQAYRIITGN